MLFPIHRDILGHVSSPDFLGTDPYHREGCVYDPTSLIIANWPTAQQLTQTGAGRVLGLKFITELQKRTQQFTSRSKMGEEKEEEEGVTGEKTSY